MYFCDHAVIHLCFLLTACIYHVMMTVDTVKKVIASLAAWCYNGFNNRTYVRMYGRDYAMNQQEYRDHIIKLIQKIDDVKILNKILNYVQKWFVRKWTGE